MMRRSVDVVASSIALLLFFPVMIGIWLIIRLTDGRPVLFRQYRTGLYGKPFLMIKFRTMFNNAEKISGSLTFQSDPRITSTGRVLRKYKLDELPQLINVLRGEMTLIGWRPEVLDWAYRYTQEQKEVFQTKPGLADPVQLLFRHEQDYLRNAKEYEQLVAIKVQKQIQYLRSRTVISDFRAGIGIFRAFFPSSPSAEELAVYAKIRESVELSSTQSSQVSLESVPKLNS